MKRCTRKLAQAVVLALIVAGSLLVGSPAASADAVYGTQSIAYSGVANPPTSDKPQSKLWWNDGSWWADMWTTGDGWHIYRLDRGTHTWVDTGLLNDRRGNTLADTLWDGTHLYIASHAVSVSTDSVPANSLSGQPAYLYRYSYDGAKYSLDAGFPTAITNNSSESMTIDQDSTGAIWATWTQVAGDSAGGFTNTVYVNNSAPGGTSWGAPFVVPVSNPNAAPDDISSVVAFGKNKIGVMWTDQLTGSVRWATRTDGTAPAASSSWNFQSAIQGKGQSADDHLNLKSLQSDPGGRVFAAVKTSLDDTSSDPTLPQLLLLVFKPGTGAFTQSTISTTGDCVSRPQVILDTQNNLVRVVQTAPATSVTGCAYSGVAGSIYEKTASMDNPVFASGRGTPIIQSASSSNINDVTTTKQGVNNSTGVVVLATDDAARRYWFSDRPLGPDPAPAPGPAVPPAAAAEIPAAAADASLGTASSAIICGLLNGGCYQMYRGSAVIWSPATGAHVSVGGIRAAWAATGYENGGLGYPTTNEVCGLRNGGCYQMYQGGAIIWSPATGAHISVGGIRAAWAATGYENGRLGYPTTNEYAVGGGSVAQDYQGGRITWSPATGTRIT